MNANTKNYGIGGDTFNFELVVDGANDDMNLRSTPLTNRIGEFGKVKVRNGKIHINVCLPKFIRADNIIPFNMDDTDALADITDTTDQQVKHILRGIIDDKTDILAAAVKSIECNITKCVTGCSTCSQVLNFINRSFFEGKNVVYQRASKKCIYNKEDESVIIPKKNYYVLKCYDKSREQQEKGNKEVDDNLLRIELIMQDRIIKKLFDGKPTIREVLTKQGLMKIIEEYKRIFVENIAGDYIHLCLKNSTRMLFESLKKTDSPVKTIALHKELIMDEEILRRALKKWHEFNGREDNSRQDLYRLKGHDFPKDVIRTIREFKSICE